MRSQPRIEAQAPQPICELKTTTRLPWANDPR
jgi:hypothetical protein